MKNMKSPCYNESTKTDCPKRVAGCHVNCPEWAIYIDKRNEEYERRKIINTGEHMIADINYNRAEGIRRYLRRERQFRKNRGN